MHNVELGGKSSLCLASCPLYVPSGKNSFVQSRYSRTGPISKWILKNLLSIFPRIWIENMTVMFGAKTTEIGALLGLLTWKVSGSKEPSGGLCFETWHLLTFATDRNEFLFVYSFYLLFLSIFLSRVSVRLVRDHINKTLMKNLEFCSITKPVNNEHQTHCSCAEPPFSWGISVVKVAENISSSHQMNRVV